MIKRILKALLASIIIFAFALLLSLVANWFGEAYPALAVIVTILIILCAGWVFTNT